ncbi:NAD(P)/FAD-dependent oxidoreductase [Alphaproteobacteria bacterium]|nr:NAD(P)/FAD-dependent oxidoreductase [Alphaproteobacteria bacterium]MDC1121466.1 NAD(P)/FAD-dependent oxidoreductase [Alphaproteobacteria bacterium]
MLPNPQQCHTLASEWISSFNHSLTAAPQSPDGAKHLFLTDSYWRDALGVTWQLNTMVGGDAIVAALRDNAARVGLSDVTLDDTASPPQWVNRAGTDAIEAFFRFETKAAIGRGIMRLCPTTQPAEAGDSGWQWRAWTLFTAIDQLKGHEEKLGRNRPTGSSYSRDFRGPNWLDKRLAAQTYEDRDPAVLVIGGGQAGLSIAARLTQLGIDNLIVDKNSRIGDNWRNRYHALTLHNQLHVNHLPYMPFPPTWPTYIPKDMLALWFESYAAAMELNVWTDTEMTSGSFDEATQLWDITLTGKDGSIRKMAPRHVILATGVSGIANRPEIPTIDRFAGTVLHSSDYGDGDDWAGKNAIVIGCGNSGHDISQDLYASGASVTMVQRSPSLVVNIEPSAQFPYRLYDEGRTTDECDFITTSMPLPLVKKAHQHFTRQSQSADKTLLGKLASVGFQLDFGEDDTGWQFKYLTRGGGYYFNVGASDLIADGNIKLIQNADIDGFTAAGVSLKTGAHIPADLVVLATGYKKQEFLVASLFGQEVADRVGPIWGFGDGLELRNMYRPTGQPGLWMIAGSFAQCRINSKYLALQIKAVEEALI